MAFPIQTNEPIINTARSNENMEGLSLEFDWQSVVAIIEDINQGLIYLHENNTIYRDLKPKNSKIYLWQKRI